MRKPLKSRRKFLEQFTGGIAGSLAAPSSVSGASRRVRVGLIGFGERGRQLACELRLVKDTAITAIADIYRRRREAAAGLGENVKTYADYRALLDQPDVEAVFVATPPHLHEPVFSDALEAGKHIYLERPLALTVEDARRMREAYSRRPKVIVQIGHQNCSSGLWQDAAEFLKNERTGRIVALRAHSFRNAPEGRPPWLRPLYTDLQPENVLWERFFPNAPDREFDADRLINWRLYADTSTGNLHEGLAHQLAFWYRLLDLSIPTEATAAAAHCRWKQWRQIPDTFVVTLRQPEGFLVSWESGFGNGQPGVGEALHGVEGTILRAQQVRYIPERAVWRGGEERIGSSVTKPAAHVANFLDAIRQRAAVQCPLETGYRAAIACAMAWESFRLQRTVRWDEDSGRIL